MKENVINMKIYLKIFKQIRMLLNLICRKGNWLERGRIEIKNSELINHNYFKN